MSWEKLPFLGAAAAVLLTAALVRMIFVVPEYNGFGWDISFYVILPVLDVYLVGYKDSRYWKPFCYAVIAFSIAALLVMQFFPEEAGRFCVRVFNDPGGTFLRIVIWY